MNKSIETAGKTIEAAINDALEQLGLSYDEVEVDIIQEAGFLKKAKVRVTAKETEKPAPAVTSTTSLREVADDEAIQPKTKIKTETKKPATTKARHCEESTTKQSQTDPQKIEKPAKPEKPATPKKTITPTDLPAKFQITLDFTIKLLELLENPAEVTHEITEKSFNINVNGNGVGQIIGKGGEVLNAIQTIISTIAIANSNGEHKRVYFNVEDYKERRVETLKAMALRKAEKVKETGRSVKLDPMNARERAIIHSALQEIEGIRTRSTGKDPHRCLCIFPAKKDEE
jgi:spoIIIJ-associated protein